MFGVVNSTTGYVDFIAATDRQIEDSTETVFVNDDNGMIMVNDDPME